MPRGESQKDKAWTIYAEPFNSSVLVMQLRDCELARWMIRPVADSLILYSVRVKLIQSLLDEPRVVLLLWRTSQDS